MLALTHRKIFIRVLVFAGFAALLGLSSAQQAEATDWAPTTSDALLIRADAIVFATVESINELPPTAASAADPWLTDMPLVEVQLTDVEVVDSRWEIDETFVFRARTKARATESVLEIPGSARVVENGRYLFFFRGGAWRRAPIVSGTQAIFEVTDGVVQCGGGQIYAIGPTGFVCSVPERQVGDPKTEIEFTEDLRAAREAATYRRPADEAAAIAAAKQLELQPTDTD